MNIRLTGSIVLLFFVLAAPVSACAATLTPHTIVALANTDRAAQGAGTLTEDALLDKAAQAKADDMAAKGYFSHIDPSGNAPWVWFKKAGYYYLRAGENLAVNFNDAQTLETAWMNSPTHRANIVKSSYTTVGVGIARGTYQGKPATFVVQFFATPYVTQVAVR